MSGFDFVTTARIINQIGGIERVAEMCAKYNIRKALIVTDQGIAATGLLKGLQQTLDRAATNHCCFDKVVADPPDSLILSAVDYAKQHQIDGVIGFGGGSAMDSAKLVALLANSDEQLADIYGMHAIKGQRLPLILIPTTAGTGSEVTPIAVVTTGNTTKAGVVSATLLPDVAVLDANLTLGLPSNVTAATGVDAMVHAIEAYTSVIKKNPYSDMLAKQALVLLSANILNASKDGADIVARQHMLFGACLAGQAFANAPVAAVHALAYPLGGHFKIPHGLSNALMLPHVMRFNLSHCAQLYAQLAPSICPAQNLQGSAEDIALGVIEYLESLLLQLELPASLAAVGIEQKDLNTLASDAMLQSRLLVNNPKTVSKDDALCIYQQAFKGMN